MICPHAGASAELGAAPPRLCSKPDVLLGLTQIPTISVRGEGHDDHVFPSGSQGPTGA